MEIPVDFKIDSEDIASKIKAAVNSIVDIELDLSVNTDSVKKAVDEVLILGQTLTAQVLISYRTLCKV